MLKALLPRPTFDPPLPPPHFDHPRVTPAVTAARTPFRVLPPLAPSSGCNPTMSAYTPICRHVGLSCCYVFERKNFRADNLRPRRLALAAGGPPVGRDKGLCGVKHLTILQSTLCYKARNQSKNAHYTTLRNER
jgi:hypothetical protein